MFNLLGHDVEMVPDVLLARGQGQHSLKAGLALLELSSLYIHHAEVVMSLNMLRVYLQYPDK